MRSIMKAAAAALLAALLAFSAACVKKNDAPEETPAPTEASTPAPTQPAETVPTASATVLSTEALPTERSAVLGKAVRYPSRGVSVPATVCVPASPEKPALAVFLHGFGGSRGGSMSGFGKLASVLYNAGIASIRMDFAGCGESTESFSACSSASMKQDALNAVSYMCSEYGTDPDRVCLIGYSLGGRVALELTADGTIEPAALFLLAPAAETQLFIDLFGGRGIWDTLKRQAEENGRIGYDFFGIELGYDFFAGLERDDNPTPEAAERFEGRAAVVYARDDSVVPPAVSHRVAETLSCRELVLESGDHSCGLDLPTSDPVFIGIAEALLDLFG